MIDSEIKVGKNMNDEGLNKTSIAQMLHTYFHPVFLHLKKMTRMCKYINQLCVMELWVSSLVFACLCLKTILFDHGCVLSSDESLLKKVA